MIKQGDIVVLKSGGPKMTVSEIKGDNAICWWFDICAFDATGKPCHYDWKRVEINIAGLQLSV